ncbi:helix-turn-helix transcriptional regulator [Streptomyces sp. NPDC005301]|uniref:helix-turn-helix transcriptional regulator n=1 Tax=Streptomyces sp. NPDC005301 TaxID=3156874 RepID=UPI0033A7A34C
MAGGDKEHADPSALSEKQAEAMLAGINEIIRAGEEMRALRAELIPVFAGFGWTQEKIARLTGMSQPAVSKQLTRHQGSDASPTVDLTLDQDDAPWLEGRLWALADAISESCGDDARCTQHVQALARGRRRFTPESVDELRRLVEEDLRSGRGELPGGYRRAYDEISRRLDVPGKSTAAATGSASVRRTLAHRIQRDWFRGDV